MNRRQRQRMSFQVTTLIAGALLLLILFVTAGYFFWLIPDEGSDAAALTPVARHHDRWRAREPRAYRYVVRRNCDCTRDYLAAYTVSVRAGVATTSFPIPVEASDGGFLEVPPTADTIEDVFAAIRNAEARGDDVSAGYDRQYGFPVAVTIRDGRSQRGWELRDFEVIEPAVARE